MARVLRRFWILMTTARNAFILILGIALVQSAVYYSQMPDVMASHFDGSGHPNGWSSRGGFFGIWLGVLALMFLSFMGPAISSSLFSAHRISIPHPDYWLAPTRLKATITHIRSQLLWFGVATIVMLIGVGQLAFEANLAASPALSGYVRWMLMGYFAFVALWLVRFLRHYYRVPRSPSSTAV